jgi:hypothetical protein
MALSREEISRINKQNAARSTGPSEAGKRKSRLNSTVHGLTATKVILPNESEGEIQQLMDDWTTYYRATAPGRRALVDRAVTATLHHERSKRYLAATLREQVRGAERAFDEEQDNIVQHYTELLPVDPAAAIRGLRRTAAGCRHVLREWFELETHLSNGLWTHSCYERATRLLGHKPEDRRDEVSFRLCYHSIACMAPVPPDVQAALLDPRTMPDTLLAMRQHPLPPAEQSGQELAKIVGDQIAEYTALARQLRIEVEEPGRAAAVDKAMLLKKDDLALWIRYERMHDSMFHRSYNTLERPEAPQPEGNPAGAEETDEPPVPAPAPAPETESPLDAANASGAVAAETPSNSGTCACPEAARTTEAGSPPATGAPGPVVADESDVERQSKRVATAEPVVSGTREDNVGMDADHEPADGAAVERGTPGRGDDQPGDVAPPAAAEMNRWRGPPSQEEAVGGML